MPEGDAGLAAAVGARIGDVLVGKYRVERALGQGGMGVVVAATHLHLDTRVAVKFLQPSLVQNRDAVARFVREARAAVRLGRGISLRESALSGGP